MKLALFLLTLCFSGLSVDSIMFKLLPNTQKCLREELKKNHIVVGEFEVHPVPGQKVDYVVTDSKQEILAQNDDIGKGKFSVVVESHDAYEICFKSRAPPDRGVPQEVYFHSKLDEEAKLYESLQRGRGNQFNVYGVNVKRDDMIQWQYCHPDSVKVPMGEAQKMKPMEVELKKLESLSQSIVQEFEEMRSREVKLSDTNESTNSRVLYLSIFSMCCLLCLSIWQVLYLRKYFKSRKLIE